MKFKESEIIMRELREKDVVSLAAIKLDDGLNVALNGEWRELVSLALTVVVSLIERAENPRAARMAFMSCIMDPDLRDMINDAEGELIYDEEAD